MIKSLVSILGILVFFYIVFLGYVYLFQHRLVYVPSRDIVAEPSQIGLAYEEMFIEVTEGNSIHAWFIPAEEKKGVVLFCHGNAGNISHRLQTIEILHNLNMSVMIFDYQGYGKSDGRPGENKTYQDAMASWKYLTEEMSIKPDKIFIMGRSLGGAVAADLAVNTDPAGIILESTFTSAKDIGAELFSFLPVRLLSRFEYNTMSKLRQISSPLMIVHSPGDEIIPYAHGLKLYENARKPRYFTEIHGGHNSGFLESRSIYVKALENFFAKYSP